ncbi:MAG: hypothetical protein H3C58_07390 [Fimbriimonadaceae bacterium]|nr:hypothetical protein [Fimbriimonadaceae bacterium]
MTLQFEREALADLAREAGRLAQSARRSLVREIKPDGSVVTNADREVEVFLRERLAQLQPGSAVWGEEFGFAEDGPGGVWLVDPVDGTTNFSLGSPLWGVSIAFYHAGEVLAGAVALPDLGETYSCIAGGGVDLDGRTLLPLASGPIDSGSPETALVRQTALRRGGVRGWVLRGLGSFARAGGHARKAVRHRRRGPVRHGTGRYRALRRRPPAAVRGHRRRPPDR